MDRKRLKEMLAAHEGRKNKPYKCTAGHETIGVGHNIEANPLPAAMAAYLKENGEITDPMIDDLLEHDIDVATLDCRKVWPGFDTFSENRQAALADFMFNVGIGTARKFVNANSAINSGDWAGAAKELEDSRWFRQVGDRARQIVTIIQEG